MSRLTKLMCAVLLVILFVPMHAATSDKAAIADRAAHADKAECTATTGDCFSYSKCEGSECRATTADQTCCCGDWGHDRRLR